MILVITILLLSFTHETHARNVCPSTTHPDNAHIQSPCIQTDSVITFDASWGSELQNFFWLSAEVQKTKDILQFQTNEYAEVLRYYRDEFKTHPTKTPQTIQNLENDFALLYDIQKQIRMIKRKLNLCYQKLCSAKRRVDLEEDLKKVQLSQTELIFKNPLLSTKTIEDFFIYYPHSAVAAKKDALNNVSTKIKKITQDTFGDSVSRLDFLEEDEPRYNKNSLKTLFIQASIEALQNLEPIKNDIGKFLHDGDSPLLKKGNEQYTKKYSDQFHEKYPYLTETILFKAETNDVRSEFLCTLNQNLNKKKNRDKIIDATMDGALLLGPLFLGPLGRIGSSGLKSLLASRLGQFTHRGKNFEHIMSGTRLGSEAGYLLHANSKVNLKEKECAEASSKFYLVANNNNYIEQKNCFSELASLRFEESLAWVGAGSLEVIPEIAKRFKKIQSPLISRKQILDQDKLADELAQFGQSKNAFALEVETKDSYYTLMDLSKLAQNKDQKLTELPNKYWHFVGDVYQARLNLTPDEIKGFVKTSEDMQHRTKIIINTKESQLSSKSTTEFNGGIGILESKKSDELLPIEKSTGMRFPRRPGEKSVEIVRLTVSKDAEKTDLSKQLTVSAFKIIAGDPQVTKAYIYTSKAHAVLYRRMGIPKEKIKTIDERDVYIELSREDLEKLVREKS